MNAALQLYPHHFGHAMSEAILASRVAMQAIANANTSMKKNMDGGTDLVYLSPEQTVKTQAVSSSSSYLDTPTKSSRGRPRRRRSKPFYRKDRKRSKPKRALSAYNIFFRHERTILKENKVKLTFAGLANTVASKWRLLPDQQREYFEILAKQDRERFRRDMELWNVEQGQHDSRPLPDKVASATEDGVASTGHFQGSSNKEQSKGKVTQKNEQQQQQQNQTSTAEKVDQLPQIPISSLSRSSEPNKNESSVSSTSMEQSKTNWEIFVDSECEPLGLFHGDAEEPLKHIAEEMDEECFDLLDGLKPSVDV